MLTPPIPVSSGQRQGSPQAFLKDGLFASAGLIPLREPTSPALWPAWGEGGAQLSWRMGGPPVGGGDSGKEATAWGPAAWGSPGPI